MFKKSTPQKIKITRLKKLKKTLNLKIYTFLKIDGLKNSKKIYAFLKIDSLKIL